MEATPIEGAPLSKLFDIPLETTIRTTEDGKRILTPVLEAERRIIADRAAELVTGLIVQHTTSVVRYDPEPTMPRRMPSPKFFYSGGGTSRTFIKRRRYGTWSKR